MSVQIENWADIRELALMSIGTNKGTWPADPGFGSDLWLLGQQGKVDGQTAGTLERMVLESLQWLVSDGLVSQITCRAERNGKNRIDYTVILSRANGPLPEIKGAWNVI